jgi:hypothetical protein
LAILIRLTGITFDIVVADLKSVSGKLHQSRIEPGTYPYVHVSRDIIPLALKRSSLLYSLTNLAIQTVRPATSTTRGSATIRSPYTVASAFLIVNSAVDRSMRCSLNSNANG